MNRFSIWVRLTTQPVLGTFLFTSTKRRSNKELHKIQLYYIKVQKFPFRFSSKYINTFTFYED
jgi:hypothetical protein